MITFKTIDFWISIWLFACYPMYQLPKRKLFKIGGYLMNTMFVAFSLIFIGLFISNLTGYLAVSNV